MLHRSYQDRFERKTAAEAHRAFFPNGLPDDPRATPLSAAWRWWGALVNNDMEMVRAVSYRPADWGTYASARGMIRGLALAQNIEPCSEAADIAYAKLIPDPGFPARVKADFGVAGGCWLTLVEEPSGWYVWGLSDTSIRPDAHRVKIG